MWMGKSSHPESIAVASMPVLVLPSIMPIALWITKSTAGKRQRCCQDCCRRWSMMRLIPKSCTTWRRFWRKRRDSYAMGLTVYNLLMSLFWSDVCILLFCLLRRRYAVLRDYGFAPLFCLLAFALVRFFIPVE